MPGSLVARRSGRISHVLPWLLLLPGAAFAQAAAPARLDGANTTWMLVATALVLLMTLPGVALFYGGMVRRKNVLSTMSQSIAIAAVVTGWLASPAIGGVKGYFTVQLTGVAATAAYSALMTLLVLLAIDRLVGLRVDESTEADGLDIVEHGEAVA